MKDFKILRRRKIKKLLPEFDIKKLEYVFLEKNNKVYITNKEILNLNLDDLNIKSVGLYFGKIKNNKIILSVEGSRILGKR